jgi:NADPH:quinone reductase-like Zn-dependent oxidoreductase
MKALLSKQAGGPETLVLEDIAEPLAGPGQVRVAVHACAVNFPDLLIIVVAAASSAEKLALAQDHGADEGVQYPVGPLDKTQARTLTDRCKSACGPDGAQVIYDCVGGDYTEAALRAVGRQGRHLVVGFTAARD